jgi:hypothetical protein
LDCRPDVGVGQAGLAGPRRHGAFALNDGRHERVVALLDQRFPCRLVAELGFQVVVTDGAALGVDLLTVPRQRVSGRYQGDGGDGTAQQISNRLLLRY